MDRQQDSLQLCTRVIASFLSRSPLCEQEVHEILDWDIAHDYLVRPENKTHIDHIASLWASASTDLDITELATVYLTTRVLIPFVETCYDKPANREPCDSHAIQEAVRYFCVKTIAQAFFIRFKSECPEDERALLDWDRAQHAVEAYRTIIYTIERVASVAELYNLTAFMMKYGAAVIEAVYTPVLQFGLPPGYVGMKPNPPRFLWEMSAKKTVETTAVC